MLSEDRKDEGLALGLDVADNLTMSRLEPFGPRRTRRFPRGKRRRERDWIGQLGIKCAGPRQRPRAVGRQPAEGRARRLLHHDVDVLILDEPTRGIDVGSKAQIYA